LIYIFIDLKIVRKGIPYVWDEGRQTGLLKSYARTAFWKALLTEKKKVRENEEKDVSSYWITWENEKILEP